MANDIKYPKKTYKITTVGPSRDWSFKGDNGEIQMRSYSVQLEGVPEWIDVSQKPDMSAPMAGDELEGHVEDTGKFGFKFVKERKGGFGGGKGFGPGAQYNSAVQTASAIVTEHYRLTGKAPKNIEEMLKRIEQLAPKIKAMVDKLAGTEKPAEDKPAPAPAAKPTEAPQAADQGDDEPIDLNGNTIDDEELGW